MIRTIKNIVFNLLIFLFTIACSFSSREVFDLSYQDRKIIQTLQKGPFYSIKENGEFSSINYTVWEFDIDIMEVEIATYASSSLQTAETYSFEIIDDIDFTKGILRLYGGGQFNNQHLGVIADTNAHGAFLKLAVHGSKEEVLKRAENVNFWEYVSEPILFVLNSVYPDTKIVALDDDGFFDPVAYDYFIPRTTAVRTSTRTDVYSALGLYSVEHYRVEGNTTTQQPTIYLLDTIVFPPNREYTKVSIDGVIQYMGVEFINTTDRTTMKIVFGPDIANVKQQLDGTPLYDWDTIHNAQLSNAPLRSLQGRQMILLDKTTAAHTYEGIYFWDNTDELIFNTSEMKLRVITTRSLIPPYSPIGVTNILDYNVKMDKVIDSKSGIFTLTGTGKYQNKYGYIVVHTPPAGAPQDAIYADFGVENTIVDAEARITALTTTPTYLYQDQNTALKSYRLVETLREIGTVWVKLKEDATGSMSYDAKDTEVFEFTSLEDRTVKYTLLQGNVNVSSFYKAKIVQDINTTNGVMQLIGYADDTYQEIDISAIMHGKYVAIDRGSELYKTQAKYAVGDSVAEAISKRNQQQLFNLHEKGSLPSNYRIITYLQGFGTWVAMTYAGSTEPGDIPAGLEPNTTPNYDRFDTYDFDFNTAVSPILTVTDNSADDPEARTVDVPTPKTYILETEEEFSEDYAIFKLTQQLSGGTGPDYNGLFMGVRVRKGVEGDKAYVVFNTDIEVIEEKIADLFDKKLYNYHAKDSAPLKAGAIETISGISYMESAVNGSQVPTGVYVPSNTKIYTFTYNPLLLRVETIQPTSVTADVAEYSLRTVEDGGAYAGVFQVEGNSLPLDKRYIRIDVQQGGRVKQQIRLLTNINQAPLTDQGITDASKQIANTSEFTTSETTHTDKSTLTFAETSIGALRTKSTTWSSVDLLDKMYDKNNNTNLTFVANTATGDTPATTNVTITIHENGRPVNTSVYTYDIITNGDSAEYNGVIKLIGSGPQRGQYLAFKMATPTVPPNNGATYPSGTKFAWGVSFATSLTALEVANLDAFVVPEDKIASDEKVKVAYENLGTMGATPPGYGTPAFVWMKDGSYDARDTELWTFGSSTNVTIDHNRVNTGVTETYSVHFLEASELTDDGSSKERASILVYLRSEKATAPYKNKYVNIRQHRMFDAAGSDGAESTFSVTIETDRNEALANNTEIKMFMRDSRSANVPARAFNLAKNTATIWTQLDSTRYQKNKDSFENWEFGYNNEFKVRVTDQADTAVIYQVTAREDTSTHRGVFLLTSENTSAKYHNHMVAIGIGGETAATGETLPYDAGTAFDSRSMRLAAGVVVDGDFVTATTTVKNAIQAIEEWNFRVKEDAELPFDPIMTARQIAHPTSGWVEMTLGDDGEYEVDLATEKMIYFMNITDFENIENSSVFFAEVNNVTRTTKPQYGIKLISASTGGLRAEFQLFLLEGTADQGSLGVSNTFVVLEVGTGLNETLMKLTTGDTLDEATVKFNELGGKYNWTTETSALSTDWGTLQQFANGRKWSLRRNNSTDITSTGSALSTTGAGWITLNDTYDNKPSYDPANTIDLSFDLANSIMYVDNKNLAQGIDLNVPYGLKRIDTQSVDESIYLLDGFGEYKNYFMLAHLKNNFSDVELNQGKSGVIVLARTIAELKTMSEELHINNAVLSYRKKRNLFNSEWIKVSDFVVRKAVTRQDTGIADDATRGAFVELGFNVASKPNVYDPLVHKTYTFIPDTKTINGVTYQEKTLIISNKSPSLTRDDIYQYELSETYNAADNNDDLKFVALLRGSGPDGNKYIGMRIPKDDSKVEAAIAVGTSEAVKAAISWATDVVAPSETVGEAGYNLYRYRVLSSVHSVATVLQQLTDKGTLVTLDQDGIYLDIDTSEWQFDAVNYNATIGLRKIDETSQTGTVKVLPIKVAGETVNQGVLYLKESTIADFNEKYIGVKIDSANIKFYVKDTVEDAIDVFTESVNNLVVKSSVLFGDEQNFTDVEIAGGTLGFGTLHNAEFDFTYNPNNTQQLLFDVSRRLGVFVRVVSASTAYTNYVRLKYTGGESDHATVGKRFAVQIISNTRTDLAFRGNTGHMSVATGTAGGTTPLGNTSTGGTEAQLYLKWYYAIGNPNGSTTDGLYYGLANTLARSRSNREGGHDPKIIPMTILRNNPQVLKSLRAELGADTDTVFYMPVTPQGTLDKTGNADSPTNYAFRVKDRTPNSTPPVYDISFGLVDTTGDIGNKIPFLTKVLADRGANNGIILPHATNTHAILSNKVMAIIKGTEASETRVKVAYADTEEEATRAVNSLEFWNYRLKDVLDTSTTLITNLADVGTVVYFSTPPTTLPPSYNEADTEDWVFNKTAGREVLTVYNVVDNVTNTSTYGIQMILENSDNNNIATFQVEGFEEYAGKYIHISFDPNTKKAAVGIATTIADAEANKQENSLFAKSTIINMGQALQHILNYTGDVTFGHTQWLTIGSTAQPFYYSRDTYSERFYLNSSNDPMVDITTVVNGVSRVDSYEMSFVKEDIGTEANPVKKAVYRLIGSGKPEHDKYLAIRVVTSDTVDSWFKIIVGDRDKKFAGGTATGNHPNDADQLLADIDDDTEARLAVKDLTKLNTDFSVVEKLQNMGDLVTLQQGVVETNKLEILNFNAGTRVLRVTTNNTTYQYEIVITDPKAIDGVNSVDSVTIILMPLTVRDEVDQYKHKYYTFDIDDDYRVVAGIGNTQELADTDLATRKGKETTSPYSYWNLETVSTANFNSSLVESLISSARRRTIYNSSDGTVYGTLSAVNHEGLAFYADPRIFKNYVVGNKPGTEASTGTTRVETNTSGMNLYGGYFDTNDYYLLQAAPVNNVNNRIRIIQKKGIDNHVTNHYQLKVLAYESATKGVFQLTRGVDNSGNVISGEDTTELATMFNNNVIAIDMGSRGIETDNIQIGYAVPESSSKTHMTVAINAAKADRDARLADQRQYIPNMVPYAMAHEQNRALLAIQSRIVKTFANAAGREVVTPDFNINNQQMLFSVNTNNSMIYAKDLSLSIRIKDNAELNGNFRDIGDDNTETEYTMRPIKTSGLANAVFKLYRPDSTTTISANTDWSEKIQDNYWAIRAGTGAYLFQSKIAIDRDPNIALENLNTLPFFNQTYMWIATEAQYDVMEKWNHYSPSDTTPSVWVQKHNTADDSQELTDKLINPESDTLNWEFFQIDGVHYVTVKEGNDSEVFNTFTYRIVPKDIPLITTANYYGSFALDGIGSLQDYFVYFRRNVSSAAGKMALHKTTDPANYDKFIQFSVGLGSYNTMGTNLKIKKKSEITGGWQAWWD